MNKLAALCLVLFSIASTTAMFFGGGGGGGGCGCGCMPSLPQPQMTCISIPALQIPIPSCPQPCCSSPCGGKRKRRAIISKQPADERCTNPSLRKLILTNIHDDSIKAQENIYEAARSFFNETDDFIVSCGPSKDFFFTTSLDTYCVDGSEKLTCSIFKYD